MPRTAASIIGRALQISKTGSTNAAGINTGYTVQALDELNSILGHICRTVDFSAARGQYNFTFATNLVSSGGGNIITSAPNPLPLDYLRVQVSGGSTGAQRSTKWYLDGVPYDMIEVDLTEFDDQVQQAGIQSYPYFCTKDMAQLVIVAVVTGDLDTSSTMVANVSSIAKIKAGMSISGGIGPQSIVTPGTTITAVGANSLTLSTAPQVQSGQANITMPQATLSIGYAPTLLIYPPPSGAFNAMIRYQRIMPMLTQAQVDAGAFPWFDDDYALIDGLAGQLMRYADDSRAVEYIGAGIGREGGRFNARIAQYIKLADDNANRSQNIQMDRRWFGTPFQTLRNSKKVGW